MKKHCKTQLRFDTAKNVRSMRLKRFAAAFSCFFVLLGGISFLLLLRHYDFNLSAISKPPQEQTTVEETTAPPAPKVEGVRNYLLACTSDSGDKVRFVAILTADMDNRDLSVTVLNPKASVSTAGCTGTFEQHFSYGGSNQLALAAEQISGIKIDKYIRSTDSKFKSIINYVGGIEVTVEKAIDIRTADLTAIIGAGEQTMTGDTMLKYMRTFEDQPQKQAELIADMIEQKLTSSYLAKADNYYKRIINLADSNISVVDFAEMKRSFEALLYDSESISVTVK